MIKILLSLLSFVIVDANTKNDLHIYMEINQSYPIINCNSKLTLNKNEQLLLGDDAEEYLSSKSGYNLKNIDALLFKDYGNNAYSNIVYSCNNIGYISMDEWDREVNATKILNILKENTTKQNKSRNAFKLFVDKWIVKPYLDKENMIVYWAVQAHRSDNKKLVNARVIKLGKNGYTKITWTGSPSQFMNQKLIFSKIIESYKYDKGFMYNEFSKEKDKVAPISVGTLVSQLILGKDIKKINFMDKLLLWIKRWWYIVGIFLILLWRNYIKETQ